jgi:hypothetical protein
MVSHRNILTNMRMIQKAASQDETRVIASWLPSYHDLGLMGGIFLPVIIGGRAVLMSPLDFLRRPSVWLSAIHRYRATDTFVPNFALDLCVRKVTTAERRSMDLGSVKLCVVAAEPVRHSTVERFLRSFEKHGFPRRSMIPGYGLAEAVVAVTGGPLGEMFRSAFVDADELSRNRFTEVASTHSRALPIVACGKPFESVGVSIVNPDTSLPAGPGEIGEVWVEGPNVALGYWRREEQTAETFRARLADGSGREMLRTGDLGYMKDGHLYITGRIKDLIIIRGKNYYPQDIELTVERSHPRVRPGAVIAFAIEHAGVERLVIVAEVDPRELSAGEDRQKELGLIVSAIRIAVNAEHALQVHSVALIKPRTIDKTSSGKLARRGCRSRYLTRTLDIELLWTLSDLSVDAAPVSAPPPSGDDARSSRGPLALAMMRGAPVERLQILTEYLAREIQRLAADGNDIGLSQETRLQEVGLDSLSAMDLAGRIEKDLGIKVPVVKLLDTTSLGELVEHLLDSMETDIEPLSQPVPITLIPPPPPSSRSIPIPTPRAVSITPPPPSRRTLPALADSGPPSSRQGSGAVRAISVAPPSVRWVRPATSPPASVARTGFNQAVALRGIVSRTPLFCVGGLGGTVAYLLSLANALGPARPFIAFQAPGIDGAEEPLGSVEEMARRYIEEMRAIQPAGPYLLAGHSFGGLVAYEMAQRLTERGEQVEHLILIDTSPAESGGPAREADDLMSLFEIVNIFRRVAQQPSEPVPYDRLASMTPDEQRLFLAQRLGADNGLVPGSAAFHMVEVYTASYAAMERYRPLPYSGAVTLFRAERGLPAETLHPARTVRMRWDDPTLGWKRLCPALRVVPVPGDHFAMVLPPDVDALSHAMQATLGDEPRFEIGLERILPAKGVPRSGRSIEVSKKGVTFNPFHPAFYEDPYPILHQLRTHDPVHWSAMSCWWITRHADVVAGLRDRRFSVDSRNWVGRSSKEFDVQADSAKPSALSSWFRRQEEMPLAQLYNNIMLLMDPPRHQQLRRLLAPSFEPSVMRRWQEHIDERVEELITEMRLRRDPDVIRDLALPLPISVISEILGVPREDASFLRPWAYDLTQGFDPFLSNDAAQRANKTAEDFMRYMREHVEKRRKTPAKSDLLSLLIDAEADGQRLTTDELVANCVLLFAAGFETVASVIGNGTLALLRNPEQMALLRDRPELIENAVEELLRYDGAIRVAFRTALEDIEIGGKLIRRGDSALFVLSAANRDPAVFADPDRLDLTRNARSHVAFAQGPHYCIGAPLARLELKSAISALARQHFSLTPGGFEWRQSISFRGLDRLRINFTS